MKPNRTLPFDCPRGLSRLAAAGYIGVSVGTFDRLVREGRMPQAKHIGARLLWDRIELDAAFDALGELSDDSGNTWN